MNLDPIQSLAPAPNGAVPDTPASSPHIGDPYRVLFDCSPVPMWVYDRGTLRFLAVNDAAMTRYGYSREEFLNMTLAQIAPPPPDGVVGALQRHRTKHGDTIMTESTTFDIVFDERAACLTVINDMTARAQLEDERERLLVREQQIRTELIDAVVRQNETLALLDSVVAAAPIGFAFLDNDLRYMRINAALAQINGRSEQEHLGSTVYELFPRLASLLERAYRQIAATNAPLLDVEIRGAPRSAPDDVRDYLVNFYPVRAPDGQMLGMGTIVLDVTDRMRAEREREELFQQLRMERMRLEAVLQQMPVGVIIAEAPSGKLVMGNEQIEHILRHPFFPSSEIKSYTDYQGFHADGRSYAPEEWPLARAITQGEIVHAEEVDMRRGDGTRGIIELNAAPIRDEHGTIVAGVVSLQDITERRAADAAVRESEERLRLALDVVQMGTWEWNFATGDVTWSAQLERLWGYEPSTMPHTHTALLDQVHVEDRERVHQMLVQAMQHGGDYHDEFRVVWTDGSEHWIVSDGQVIQQAQQPRRMIGVSRDITERKRAEVERTLLLEREQAARASAEQALNVREQFLSVASHELKTPLTALMGYTSMLQKRVREGQPVGQRESRAVSVIAQQTNRLYELVATLFDLSRIETGQLALQQQPLDLAALAQRVVNDTQTTLTVRHRLHLVRPRLPVLVRGDEMRLEQVLQNLLQNAIKYSPDGGIVTVRLWQQDEHAMLSVSDQGIGIPQNAHGQLFQRFFRATNVSTQQIGGLGIGLYVAHEIVRRHGGTIDVESREGEGALFTVRLPLARDEERGTRDEG